MGLRERLIRAGYGVLRTIGFVLAIGVVAAVTVGFSGGIIINPSLALAPGSSVPATPTPAGAPPPGAPSPGATASPPPNPDSGPRRSPSPVDEATCTRLVRLDATGSTDVTGMLQAFVDGSPEGSVICLEPGGRYRMDGQLHLANRRGLTIEGRGATVFATERSALARILIDHGGSGIRVRNITIEGYWPEAGTADAAILKYEGNHGIAIGGAEDVEIGPNVVIRNVGGDGVYVTAGQVGPSQRWADGIHVHDTVIERNGRMGVAITDGARNVVVEHSALDAIALYAFDIEPNGQVFDGVPAGAEHIRFSDNTVGTYGLSPVLVPWLFAGTGQGPQTDVEFSRNVVTGGALRIGVWDVAGTPRTDFRILDNASDTEASGPVMVFQGVDGLEVRRNHQPLSFGRLATVTDSTVIGSID